MVQHVPPIYHTYPSTNILLTLLQTYYLPFYKHITYPSTNILLTLLQTYTIYMVYSTCSFTFKVMPSPVETTLETDKLYLLLVHPETTSLAR